jgi:hypothetical protein
MEARECTSHPSELGQDAAPLVIWRLKSGGVVLHPGFETWCPRSYSIRSQAAGIRYEAGGLGSSSVFASEINRIPGEK